MICTDAVDEAGHPHRGVEGLEHSCVSDRHEFSTFGMPAADLTMLELEEQIDDCCSATLSVRLQSSQPLTDWCNDALEGTIEVIDASAGSEAPTSVRFLFSVLRGGFVDPSAAAVGDERKQASVEVFESLAAYLASACPRYAEIFSSILSQRLAAIAEEKDDDDDEA